MIYFLSISLIIFDLWVIKGKADGQIEKVLVRGKTSWVINIRKIQKVF